MKHDGKQDSSAKDMAERFYRLLLSLYPAEHRDSYEVPMLQLFRDIYRQEVKSGGHKTVLQFWAFILKDGVRSLFREHITQGAKPMSIVSSVKPNFAAGVGLILLAVPSYFVVASALRQNAPGLSLLGSPMILLGALFIAFSVNSLSILSVNLRNDTPSVLSVSLSLRFWNLAVIGTALVLLGVLLGYAFVENFQARPVG
jgi:hypothetical protein